MSQIYAREKYLRNGYWLAELAHGTDYFTNMRHPLPTPAQKDYMLVFMVILSLTARRSANKKTKLHMVGAKHKY